MELEVKHGLIKEEKENLSEINTKVNGKMEKDMVWCNKIIGFGVFYYANGTKFIGFWNENQK